jgi:DNA-binding CsgD family transcriptional regulator
MRLPGPLVGRWVELEVTKALGGIADITRTRETVVLSADAGGAFELNPRYREILRPLDLKHELRVVFRDHGTTWGLLGIFRSVDRPEFRPEEVDLLEQMAAPFAQGLRRTNLSGATESGPLDDRPAVLVLSADIHVVSCTDAAERLLAELRVDGCHDPERLPLCVRALALRVSRHPAATGSVSSRARTRRGQWVTIRGAALEAEQRIIIVMDRTPRTDVVPVILAAHGLTARERTVAEHVLLGLSSQDVSEALGISQYTVQDHLKAVFDKTGVSSRKELAARLFASVAPA